MIILTHLAYDVNDVVDQRQQDEDKWECSWIWGPEPPSQFDRLVEGGMAPEEAADVVDLVDRCVEADRITRLGKEGAETMGLVMEINYGTRIPA